MMTPTELRERFIHMLTTDSPSQDARRKGFRQAIFRLPEGYAVWSSTDLEMVMRAFDLAARDDIPMDGESYE